jgi:hypothetical protein
MMENSCQFNAGNMVFYNKYEWFWTSLNIIHNNLCTYFREDKSNGNNSIYNY